MVTTTQAMRNALASARMEGLTFTDEKIELIRQIVDGEITVEEVIGRFKDVDKSRETNN
jgi:hypothetical protein